MLTGLTITQIYVPDQDQALDFYVGKLGFEVTNDMQFGPMRWLTVALFVLQATAVLLVVHTDNIALSYGGRAEIVDAQLLFDADVTVPDSDTPTGSYPATSPNAVALVVGLL